MFTAYLKRSVGSVLPVGILHSQGVLRRFLLLKSRYPSRLQALLLNYIIFFAENKHTYSFGFIFVLVLPL